ncbi:MAG: ERCC4 domain-containing protein [Candidatus Pacearchaeota archaeon]
MKPIFNIFSKKPIEKKLDERKIIVDYREKNSLVISNLISLGINVEFRELKVGDYVARNVIIERKTVSDFISSMLNKRLLQQIEDLKQIENKLLIIEGIDEKELYNDNPGEFSKGVGANAIRGFLLSIVLRHKIPIIFSKNPEDTAKYLLVLLNKKEKEMSMNAKKKGRNKKEQLEFILEGFPGIGPKTAKKLLKEFKTIQNIINADIEHLRKIIGKKADTFIGLINQGY